MKPGSVHSVLISGLRIVLLTTVLIVAGLYFFQRDLLYLLTDSATVAQTLAATGSKRARAWPDEPGFRGVLFEPERRSATGTVLLFHGNAGHAGHRVDYAEEAGRYGWRVILLEYPGYGARPGTAEEQAIVDDAVESIARARQQFADPLVLAGESLGAGVVAAAVAALRTRGQTVDGLLLITPWDKFANAVAHHYPWLPVRLLLQESYDSVANLRGYDGPTVVVVAGNDRIVPARLGRSLFESLQGKKELLVVDGADHNDWYHRLDAAWWKRVSELLAGVRQAE
jgi:pimeloyl-ACP methyl ester carboxylesterase